MNDMGAICVAVVVTGHPPGRSFSTQHGSRDRETNSLKKLPRSGPRCRWLPIFNQLFCPEIHLCKIMMIWSVDFTWNC